MSLIYNERVILKKMVPANKLNNYKESYIWFTLFIHSIKHTEFRDSNHSLISTRNKSRLKESRRNNMIFLSPQNPDGAQGINQLIWKVSDLKRAASMLGWGDPKPPMGETPKPPLVRSIPSGIFLFWYNSSNPSFLRLRKLLLIFISLLRWLGKDMVISRPWVSKSRSWVSKSRPWDSMSRPWVSKSRPIIPEDIE
jgi:hypothetical protein